MISGETVKRAFFLYVISTKAAQTGKVIGDFAVGSYLNGVSTSVSHTLTEIGSGYYYLTMTLPANGQHDFFIRPTDTTLAIDMGQVSNEIESYDLTSVYSVAARPVVQQVAGAPGAQLPLAIFKGKYREITLSIVDQAGAAVDLSGYDTWRLVVHSLTQDTEGGTLPVTISSGISGTALGAVSIAIAETAFNSVSMTNELAAGLTSRSLRYTLYANKAADASKTEVLSYGPLALIRSEG